LGLSSSTSPVVNKRVTTIAVDVQPKVGTNSSSAPASPVGGNSSPVSFASSFVEHSVAISSS
jgi:hypothetical protein